MDYTVHGILQAKILEWVAFPFSRGSSQPRDQTQVPHIAGGLYQLSHKRRGLDYRITKSLDMGSQRVVHDWATKAHHVSKSCPMMICISVYVLDGNSKLEHSFNKCMVYSGICLLHFLQVMTLRYSFSICLNIWRCIQVWPSPLGLTGRVMPLVMFQLIYGKQYSPNLKNLLYFKMHFYSNPHLFSPLKTYFVQNLRT